MTVALPALAALAAFVGAMLQRSTGMGFALVTAPFMMLALGPLDGIVLTNIGSAATSFVTAFQMRRDFDHERARWLIPAGLVGCVPGALIVQLLPADLVALVVGAIVLAALLVTLAAPGGRMRDGRATRIGTGLVSGFMNTSAGVGGPALAVYTRGIGWPRKDFAATATVIFGIQGVTAVILKHHLPAVGALGWGLFVVAIPLGLAAGQVLHGRLDDRAAMRAVMTLAIAGTVLALAKAIWSLAA